MNEKGWGGQCDQLVVGEAEGVRYVHTYVPYEDEFRDGAHVLRMEWKGMNVVVLVVRVKNTVPDTEVTRVVFPDMTFRGELYLTVEAPSKELWFDVKSKPLRWRRNEHVRLNWRLGRTMIAMLTDRGYEVRTHRYSTWVSVETDRMKVGGNTISWKEMYDLARLTLDRLISISLATLRREGQVKAEGNDRRWTTWTFVGNRHSKGRNTGASPGQGQE